MTCCFRNKREENSANGEELETGYDLDAEKEIEEEMDEATCMDDDNSSLSSLFSVH